MKVAYDLHIHSCLSPCADDEMTPATIAGMGKLIGLNVMALTDHNTTKNCPAFFKACEFYGILPIAGMELTTAEEIHMLCLFSSLESAQNFELFLDTKRLPVKNKPDIFGRQYIVDENDTVIGEYPYVLSFATSLTVDEAITEIKKRNAFICPAHIDREANGMIGVLGTVPSDYNFKCVEFKSKDNEAKLRQAHGIKAKYSLYDSDAHELLSLSENLNYLHIEGDVLNAETVLRSLGL